MRFNRIGWLIPALIPFLLQVPYLLNAWHYSRRDQWDGLFYLLAIALAAACFRRVRSWAAAKPDWLGLAVMALGLLVIGAAYYKHISTAKIGGSIIFFFGTVFLLYGRKLFIGVAPLLLISLLGCPSTTYWGEYYFNNFTGLGGETGLWLKAALALGAGAWFVFLKKTPPFRHLLFAGLIIALGVLLLARLQKPLYGEPLAAEKASLQIGPWLGGIMSLSAEDLRFFSGSTATRYGFYSTDDMIGFLVVEVTGNIHNIHPPQICLSSGGNRILQSREKILETVKGPLALQETMIEHPDFGRSVVYSWYVGPQWSTGNFLVFRSNWKANERWRSFQARTGFRGEDVEEGQRKLEFFINGWLEGEPKKP